MKRSIMVPVVNDTQKREGEEGVLNKNHPFMRGIMNFDDYNYNHYNSFVLLENPKKDAQTAVTIK